MSSPTTWKATFGGAMHEVSFVPAVGREAPVLTVDATPTPVRATNATFSMGGRYEYVASALPDDVRVRTSAGSAGALVTRLLVGGVDVESGQRARPFASLPVPLLVLLAGALSLPAALFSSILVPPVVMILIAVYASQAAPAGRRTVIATYGIYVAVGIVICEALSIVLNLHPVLG
jgi:hypothetical protein